MENTKEMITIQNSDGSTMEVELVTFLMDDDQTNAYLVYSKGEKTGVSDDEVIYVSKVVKKGEVIQIQEIVDDLEWAKVQKLMKKIANM